MNIPDITPSVDKKTLVNSLTNNFYISVLSAARLADYMLQVNAEPYLNVPELPDSLWVKSVNPEGKTIYIILTVLHPKISDDGKLGEYRISTIHSQESDPKVLNNTGLVMNNYLLQVEDILNQESD